MYNVTSQNLQTLEEKGQLRNPNDALKVENGTVKAMIECFQEKDGNLIPVIFYLQAELGEALKAFQYNKPIISNGDLLHPDWKLESVPREGYYPIGIVHGARMPNHMNKVQKALAMVVEKEGGWETRYFPIESLTPKTWNEGVELVKKYCEEPILVTKEQYDGILESDWNNYPTTL